LEEVPAEEGDGTKAVHPVVQAWDLDEIELP
jgi:hypothetical protein